PRLPRWQGCGSGQAVWRSLQAVPLHPPLHLRAALAEGAGDGADVALVLGEQRGERVAARALLGGPRLGSGGGARRLLQRRGQMLELDAAGAGERDGGGEALLELADVQGPAVLEQRAGGG